MIIVGFRDLDPLWLSYGLQADLYRSEEEKAALKDRYRQLFKKVLEEEDE